MTLTEAGAQLGLSPATPKEGDMTRKDENGQPLCNCSALPSPCIAYPTGRAKGRTGRCEACAMGLHKSHGRRED